MALNEIRGSTQIKDASIPLSKLESNVFSGTIMSAEYTGDGVSNSVVLPSVPSKLLFVTLRGLLRFSSEYTATETSAGTYTITFNETPDVGDGIYVLYLKAY